MIDLGVLRARWFLMGMGAMFALAWQSGAWPTRPDNDGVVMVHARGVAETPCP